MANWVERVNALKKVVDILEPPVGKRKRTNSEELTSITAAPLPHRERERTEPIRDPITDWVRKAKSPPDLKTANTQAFEQWLRLIENEFFIQGIVYVDDERRTRWAFRGLILHKDLSTVVNKRLQTNPPLL